MSEKPQIVARAAAEPELVARVREYEERFGTVFETLTLFSNELLRAPAEPALAEASHRYAISSSPIIRQAFGVFRRVANGSSPSRSERRKYLQALLDVYTCMRRSPTIQDVTPTLTVAPKREGMLIAKTLGWLNTEAITPEMKRIPVPGGLAVASERLTPQRGTYGSCTIVDGAIASGATVMTILEHLHGKIQRFEVLAVHATLESVGSIAKCSDRLGTTTTVHAGWQTRGLNEKYYAVDESDPTKLVVGDLGDIIAPLFSPTTE